MMSMAIILHLFSARDMGDEWAEEKRINQSDFPCEAIVRVARCLLPHVLADFESETMLGTVDD